MKAKRITSLLLALLMLITCFSGMTMAYAGEKAYTKDIKGVSYTYSVKNNKATITEILILDKFKGSSLEIPSKLGGKRVVSVGDWAYYNYAGKKIKTLKLADTIESLGEAAFNGNFENVYLGTSLKRLDDGAILNSYKKLTISSKNNSFVIKDNVLYNKDKTVLYLYPSKSKGSSFTVPETVKEIGGYAFSHSPLSKIKLPSDLKEVGDGAFYDTAITSFSLPKTVTKLGYFAFGRCGGLKSVDLSKTKLKTIETDTFCDSDSLTSIKLPDTVEEFKKAAFEDCGITKLYIPDSLKKVDFYDLRISTNYEFKAYKTSDRNKNYSAKDGVLYSKDMKTLVSYPKNKSGKEYKAPKTITKISYGSFQSCSNLKSVDLSATSVKEIPRCTFGVVRSLKSIKLPDCVKVIGDGAFEFTGLTSFAFPKSLTTVGNGAFWGTRLENIDLSNTRVTTIEDEAFGNIGFKTLKLPSTLNTIGVYAFADCQIENLVIPKSVKKIGSRAFDNCKNLKNVYVKSADVKYGKNVFYNYVYVVSEGEDKPSNIITIHAPSGSTSEKYAGKYKNLEFKAKY